MRFVISGVLVFLAAALQAATPTIDKVLPCGKVGSAGGLGAGTDLQRFTVDVRRFPEAVCNDGSPAVFYYGRYTKDEDRNKWVIFLQGGGECTSPEGCVSRWCSIDTNYGMDKMTTTLTKPLIQGNGVLDPRAENRFGSWNRVMIFYCSSDEWHGTKTSAVHASANGVNADFTIHFKGSRIVDAVIATLQRNYPRRAAAPPGTTGNALPDLDNATHVLFAGSSAGGAGVRNNADRLSAALKSKNPSLVFKAAIDADFVPSQEQRDYAHSTACKTDPAQCSYTTSKQKEWTETEQGLWGVRGDESCLSWHAAHEPGTDWRCADGTHVMVHHVTSPMYVREDLQDESLGPKYVDNGFGTMADFGRIVEQQLRDLALLNTTAEEGSVRAGGTPLATPGAFGPQCTDHESFKDDTAFFDVKVNGVSFHDTLWNWYSGGQPQVAIRTFQPPGGAVAGCPPPD